MHVTDLAFNHAIGLRLAEQGASYILEKPEAPLPLNHVGTIHASAQFALAEACSGEYLLRQLKEMENQPFAVLRTSNVKFRKPARGLLRASARLADNAGKSLSNELAARGRALVAIAVEVSDAEGLVTMIGQYDWFLQTDVP